MKTSKLYLLLTFLLSRLLQLYYKSKHPQLDQFQLMLLVRGRLFRVYQYRYFIHDYIIKKPYKVIDCECEFGAELKWYVPFAFWHFKNGTLLKTISSSQTRCLYYFSPHHEETPRLRKYKTCYEIPNSEDHNYSYDLTKWSPPPYGEYYTREKIFNFVKPLLIISNKYTTEWERPPTNYIPTELIIKIIHLLHQHFTIIYNRPEYPLISTDTGSDFINFDDKLLIHKEFSDVLMADEIFKQHVCKYNNFNEFQLMLYSQCKNFISVQGGNSVLASYFAGKNLVYLVEGHEKQFKEYKHFYHHLSRCDVEIAQSEKALLEKTKILFTMHKEVVPTHERK